MASIPCQDQWTLLLQLQSNKLQEQQLHLRHQTALRKLYYKRQLDDHIARTEGRGRREKEMDIEVLRQKQRQDEIEKYELCRREEEKRRQRRDALEQNVRAMREKEERARNQKKRESEVVTRLLLLNNEAALKERRTESEKKTRQKQELVSAYNDKMDEERMRRQAMKTEESAYLSEFRKVEERKEKQREEFLNKIRYGFKQNPEAYNNIIDIESKKDEERKSAISNYIGPMKVEEYSFTGKPSSSKAQRQSNMRSLSDLPDKQTYTPQQKKRMKEIEGQMYMGDILDKQIEEKEMQRIKDRHMNGKEIKYNKDSFQGMMATPGLSINDYHRTKQREILNNSIGLEYRPNYHNYHSRDRE